jgi:hypothetical protein
MTWSSSIRQVLPVQFYAELGAVQLGMPYIHVSAALYLDFSGYTPLSIYAWPHQTTAAALARNREGVAKFAKMLEGSNAGIRAHAKTVGLKIGWENPGSTLSPFASITQVPRAFDFESSHWPSQFHHTGPFHGKQTGVVTSLDKLTADHLSTLLDEVLNESAYRDNARKLQNAIAKANGLSVAADLIEQSLGVTAKAAKE